MIAGLCDLGGLLCERSGPYRVWWTGCRYRTTPGRALHADRWSDPQTGHDDRQAPWSLTSNAPVKGPAWSPFTRQGRRIKPDHFR